MLTLVTMDKGHNVTELFGPENVRQWQAVEKQLRSSKHVLDVVSPLTALEFDDALVRSPSGDPTQSVAGKALLGAISREKSAAAKALRNADAVKTLSRLNAVTPSNNASSPTRSGSSSSFTTTRGTSASRCARSSPTIVTRSWSRDSREISRSSTRATRPTSSRPRPASSNFDHTLITTTGAPVLLKNINDYLTGGMLTLGAIAVGIMVLILALLFGVRWRLLPLVIVLTGVVWAFGIAGYIGIPLTIVTIAGLPVMLGIGIDYAIQMHARVEEEVAVGHRAPDPGDVAQPRARAARRHLRRGLRVRGVALRQGADAPPVRAAARGRRRGDLPEQHPGHARHPRHPRVQVADEAGPVP